MQSLSLIAAIFLYIGSFNAGYGEEKTKSAFISGTIIEASSGEALTGVEIEIVGTGKTLYSDFDGKFEIERPENESLVSLRISYISYKSVIIRDLIPDNGNLIIRLKSDKKQLSRASEDPNSEA